MPDDRFVMSAREGGYCPVCHDEYDVDDDVVHDAQLDGWVHLECSDEAD